jgi:DNA-binding transcriptional LysR family regulator
MSPRKKLVEHKLTVTSRLGGLMTLHQLRIFHCVARYLNITKASEALHISQPSVSHQLKMLEEEFGIRLFVRRNQGVELTAGGRKFVDASRPILTQAEELEKTFKINPKASKSGPLIVGGSHNVSVNVLPKLLRAFKSSHPSVRFVLESNTSPTMEKRLLNSEVEIALITNPSHLAELVYEPYEEIEVVAFCRPRNPLAGKQLTLRELAASPLIVRSGGRIEKAVIRQGVNIALKCEASEAVKVAVEVGMGVGILYRNAVASCLAHGTLRSINVPELKELGIKCSISYHRRKPLAPIAQEFLRMVRERKSSTAQTRYKL